MSRRAAAVPNAWDDDDWVSQADKEPSSSSSSAAAAAGPPPALNRQERLQQHAEANRRLWESADSAETFHYIEATSGGAPLAAAPFRPQVKVLSRKPAATAAATDDDADADSRRAGAQLLTPEEIRAKQRRERDEKQRRYDEARAKIFGESAPSSRGSSPGAGAVTPPRSDPPRGGPSAARARGRGNGHRANSNYGGGGYNSNNNSSSSSSNTNTNTNINHNTNFTSYPSTNTTSSSGGSYYNNGSSGNHTPGPYNFENRRPPNPSGPTRELYDPNSSPKPDPLGRGRGSTSGDNSPRVQTPRADHPQQQYQQQQQAIRSPRGPDSSGRGGFGLARRGARET
ncbi:hypothetical protein ESCO_004894 [Escovopsis weberi]|uniref:Uncharacterized protein n=1 Tax=Escovopsis weberi TaxID=150374 RepID=A0A0M8MU58_ESCWE|nr:hypothetical protein ESCO_004894 [Escovopsis weberi]